MAQLLLSEGAMHDANEFLKALATVLCMAAVTTVLFQRLKQPVVLGYLLAGLIVGPYVPIPLEANTHVIETLSALGVILLMFSLGLEFSLRKLIRVGPTAGLTAVIECSLMLWLGFNVGRAFGWTSMECLFIGAIIAISSTTIVAKAFDEQGVSGPRRELVVAILIVEDLIAILLMATLTALAGGAKMSASGLAFTAGRLALFLAALIAAGLLILPRVVRSIVKLGRPETIVVASIGICFAVALLAAVAGYSVALGAFLAGSLVAESGESKTIEHLIQPVRDMFAAIFFVSVGMLIDPKVIAQHWLPIVILTVCVVVGKIGAVSLGAFLTGNGTRRSVQASMSLAQIGEFSFIIAGLGVSTGAIRPFMYPVPIAVSLVTTLLTPMLIRAADPAARLLDRKLPPSLQTFTALYASWLDELRTRQGGARGKVGRLVKLLLLDAALLTGVIIGAAVASRRLYAWMEEYTRLSPGLARVATISAGAIAAIPFLVGIFRLAGRLGIQLAEAALPPGEKLDLAAAPRKALVVTLQLTVILALGIPMIAIIQPFVRGIGVTLVLIGMVAFLAVAFWKSAANLQGHVIAGAGMIVEALAAQTNTAEEHPDMAVVSDILPGLGEPKAVRLTPQSYATGRTLAELNLRGMTGATVLALVRKNHNLGTPDAHQRLEADDVLALAGSKESVLSAEELLRGPGAL